MATKRESDPVTSDEWLLRRVRIERMRTEVSGSAFQPRVKGREPDTDGISLYRESCLDDPREILATVREDTRHEVGIVRVSVAELARHGLTVVPVPTEPIPGHVQIPSCVRIDTGRINVGASPS